MTGIDNSRRLQIREFALSEEVKRTLIDPFLGSSSLLVRTTTVRTYPTSAQVYYACQPLTLLGTEIEGNAGVSTTTNSIFFALNVGSTIPPVGTQVVVTFVGNRWVFRYDG